MINSNSSRKSCQWTDSCYSVGQQNKAVYSWVSLSISKTLFPAHTVFFNTNQSNPSPSSHLPLPLSCSLPETPLLEYHSSGMNLPRLEHSAKGHYPGLHVCWAAVLSNSTRCCCDQWVTCKGKDSSCTSSLCSLLSNLIPSEIWSAEG